MSTDDFNSALDRLISGYRRVIKIAHDALAPDKSQEHRDKVRKTLGEHLDEPSGPQDSPSPK